MMTSNRPLEDWGKLIGDVPSATAILDRFLHHAEILRISGKSYRLRNQARAVEDGTESKSATATLGPEPPSDDARPAGTPIASEGSASDAKLPDVPAGHGRKANSSKPARAPIGSEA